MQIGRFLRKGAERFVTNPVRGVGRIARGNVRQGLRDIAPGAKVAAMFIPGGMAASAGLGALAGALEQESGASVGDFARGALGGASTAMAGRGAQQKIRGLFSGGGPLPAGAGVQQANIPGPGMMTGGVTPLSSAPLPSGATAAAAPGMMTGGVTPLSSAPLPGVPPVLSGRAAMDSLGRAQQAIPGFQAPATASMSGLSRAAEPVGSSLGGVTKGAGSVARDVVSKITKESPSRLSRLGSAGRFAKENAEIIGPLIGGMFESREGQADRALKERELAILEGRESRAEREYQEERERRQRVAQMLAPLFQQMQQRQYFS